MRRHPFVLHMGGITTRNIVIHEVETLVQISKKAQIEQFSLSSAFQWYVMEEIHQGLSRRATFLRKLETIEFTGYFVVKIASTWTLPSFSIPEMYGYSVSGKKSSSSMVFDRVRFGTQHDRLLELVWYHAVEHW